MTQKTPNPSAAPHPDLNIDRAQIAALGKAYEEAKAKGTAAGAGAANLASQTPSMDESMKRGLREMAAYLNMR